MLGHEELRRVFLDYFLAREHRLVASASLVPRDDPSLLFTSAGMVQFKSFYAMEGVPPYRRALSIQKCLRAGGKDSDLELVGRSPRHLTFFEMLGHFSFGDYFKQEAVAYAHEFFEKELCVDMSRIWVSIFEEDDEAEACWKKVGFPAERIVRLGVKDNFWGPAGNTGACGPSSEIYWDLGAEMASGEIGGGPGRDDRYIEVWNAVFPQFDQQPDGSRKPLPNRGIDMGSGLERMCLMLQGKQNIFDTDLFRPILDGIKEITGYDGDESGEALVALRRIADHGRALAFTLGEGLVPSNVGRGYVLRRILRRAVMAMRALGTHEPALYRVLGVVTKQLGRSHPELAERAERSALLVKAEEERFLRTLEQGMGRYKELIAGAEKSSSRVLPGDEVFKLYSTFGIPWELTQEMAAEDGYAVDEKGYHAALAADREISQTASSFAEPESDDADGEFEFLLDETETEFLGYGATAAEARAVAWRAAGDGELDLLLDRSPFYATAGGQIADTGRISVAGRDLEVLDVRARGGRRMHRVRMAPGQERADLIEKLRRQPLSAEVDAGRRRAIARAHTATHLLHAALHRVIGEDATQAGSWVGPDRLRFDFNHFRALTQEELAAVERQASLWILENHAVRTELLPIAAALERGAMALFGEKYGDEVRVVSIGDESLELCGGTHLDSSGAVGPLLVTAEGSVASGVRRIEAITGIAAQEAIGAGRRSLASLTQKLRVPEADLPSSVEELMDERQKLRREIEGLRMSAAASRSDELLKPAGSFGGIGVLRGLIEGENPKEIRNLADTLRGKLGESVGALLADAGGKYSFLILVPDALVGRGLSAGQLIGTAVAAIGGRGGGSPTLAQAGLQEPEQFEVVLAALTESLVVHGEAE